MFNEERESEEPKRDEPPAVVSAEVDEQTEAVSSESDQQSVEQDIGELIAKASERDEYLALAQRTQADFENYRRRVAREAQDAQLRGVAELALGLFPALDGLDRAVETADEGKPNTDTLIEGMRLLRNEIREVLGKYGVRSYSPEGERFNPEQHEAVAQHPIEGAQPGTVAEVYQCGYTLGESVLRPARVVVAE